MMINDKIKQLFSWRLLIGVLLGGVAGYIYYYFWGCNGACAITSSPIKTVIFGSLLGGLFAYK